MDQLPSDDASSKQNYKDRYFFHTIITGVLIIIVPLVGKNNGPFGGIEAIIIVIPLLCINSFMALNVSRKFINPESQNRYGCSSALHYVLIIFGFIATIALVANIFSR